MKRLTLVIATASMAIIMTSLSIEVSHAGLLGGAMKGALFGSLVGGRDGARTGAVVGGVVGAVRASGHRKRERHQRAAAKQRQKEWAAQQRNEQARIEQQRANAAPALTANQTLIVETQKSLIRLGYEPGTLGQVGPKLTRAVITYQKSKRLLETGELSQALLTHMLRNGG